MSSSNDQSTEEDVVVVSSSDNNNSSTLESTDVTAELAKRRRDDDEDAVPEEKKIRVETSSGASIAMPTSNYIGTINTGIRDPNLPVPGPGEEIHIIEIPPEKVGQVIGSRGAVIQEMQQKTSARIYVNQNFPPGVNREVHITGTPFQVKIATDLVKKVIELGPTAIHNNMLNGGPIVTQVMECTQDHVGRVIGTAGATIKDIQQRSGARIQIEQNFPEGVPRQIHINGTQAAVASAMSIIQQIIDAPGGPASSGGGHGGGGGHYGPAGGAGGAGGGWTGNLGQASGGTTTKVMEVPRIYVGKIIGRKGENVMVIAKKTGCKIQIEQDMPPHLPCKVNISGPPAGIAMAEGLIFEIMGGPPGATASMGGAMMGGMGAGPAAAGMGAMGMGMNVPGMGLAGMMNPMMAGMMNPYMMAGMMNPNVMQQMQGYGFGYGGQQPGVPGVPGMGAAAVGGMGPMGAVQPQPQQQQPQQQNYGYGGYGQQVVQQAHSQQQPRGQQGHGQQQGHGGHHQQRQHQGQHQQQQAGYGGSSATVSGGSGAGGAAGGAASWTEHKTDDGHVYWYNAATGVSTVSLC